MSVQRMSVGTKREEGNEKKNETKERRINGGRMEQKKVCNEGVQDKGEEGNEKKLQRKSAGSKGEEGNEKRVCNE